MPTIARENVSDLTALLTINLKKEDYINQFEADLKRYKKQVSLKGFRPGKTPTSVVKKMYGKQILVEKVNQVVQKQIEQYLDENKVEILGNPIPVEDHPQYDFDLNTFGDYEFKYELGLAPEFELKGFNKKSSYDSYEIEVEDSVVDEEVSRYKKQLGATTNPEGDIKDFDILNADIKELGKEDGFEKNIVIAVDKIEDAKLKKQVLKLKKGDAFECNLFKLENKSPEEFKKFILGLPEDAELNEDFALTITEVRRIEEAAVDQEMFDKIFGEGEVKSEDEFRDKIKEQIGGFYEQYTDQAFFRGFQKNIVDKNELELPKEFLKRWLAVTNEKLTAEQIDADFESFEGELKWSLVRSKIIKANDISVSNEEILSSFKDSIRSYFGGQGNEEMVNSTAQRLLQDQEQVEKQYQTVLSQKVISVVKENVKLATKKVSKDELEELLKA